MVKYVAVNIIKYVLVVGNVVAKEFVSMTKDARNTSSVMGLKFVNMILLEVNASSVKAQEGF